MRIASKFDGQTSSRRFGSHLMVPSIYEARLSSRLKRIPVDLPISNSWTLDLLMRFSEQIETAPYFLQIIKSKNLIDLQQVTIFPKFTLWSADFDKLYELQRKHPKLEKTLVIVLNFREIHGTERQNEKSSGGHPTITIAEQQRYLLVNWSNGGFWNWFCFLAGHLALWSVQSNILTIQHFDHQTFWSSNVTAKNNDV